MDDHAQLAWLRQVYFALDGRWYLKTRERFGAAVAQEVNDAVIASLGRVQLRAWRELTGVERFEDCRSLGRFVLDVLDVLYGSWRDAVEVVTDRPDEWAMRHTACTIFDMAVAAGYEETPRPGALPGCGGLRALTGAWVAAAGPFTVEQLPALSPAGGVACRYVFRLAD